MSITNRKTGAAVFFLGLIFDILHLSTGTERYAVTRIGLVYLNTATGH